MSRWNERPQLSRRIVQIGDNVWMIAETTTTPKTYTVIAKDDGTFECTCHAFRHPKPMCVHIDVIEYHAKRDAARSTDANHDPEGRCSDG